MKGPITELYFKTNLSKDIKTNELKKQITNSRTQRIQIF